MVNFAKIAMIRTEIFEIFGLALLTCIMFLVCYRLDISNPTAFFQFHYIPEAAIFFLCGFMIGETEGLGVVRARTVWVVLISLTYSISLAVSFLNPSIGSFAKGFVPAIFLASSFAGYRFRRKRKEM